MNRSESVEFLHKKLGYSRRMSSKLTDIAFLAKDNNVFAVAVREALVKAMKKEK